MGTLPRLSAQELGEVAASAVLDRIRQALRARIMERIEPDIQASVEAAMEVFKVTVGTWKEFATGEMTFKFLIEDRREDKK